MKKHLSNLVIKLSKKSSEIANKFNKHFTSIAKQMKENLVKPKSKHYKYLKNQNTNSFFISPTNSDEVLSVIKELSNNKSSGPASIRSKLSKNCLKLPLVNLYH